MNNRFYYHLKPYVPWRWRMALRRVLARRKWRSHKDVWPINEAAATPPAGWTGWPDGKKFALILTHDVEGPRGLAKCQQLLQLEKDLGFRSSFNFIPESDYMVSSKFRGELTRNGFEVGVHDLRHDGKLYWSRRDFSDNAKEINRYLKEWGAVGFRSGFMHHQLDWLHDLEIQYDASTFDTDPFEPQPDGANTIFPFWVPAPHNPSLTPLTPRLSSRNSGFVELPYTLSQDSTLFLLFREQTTAIWRTKLDWLVQQGGMALMDTHPDYMNFDGSMRPHDEYPSAWYKEFLEYVAEKYRDLYWTATPKELAEWYRSKHKSASPPITDSKNNDSGLKGKKAAVVLYSYYPSDPRPRRAAEALVDAGMEVDMICLRQKASEPKREVINGVKIRRVPVSRKRDGKLTYLFQYGSFISICMVTLAFRSLRKRYDLVHVHNMPDVLVFSGLVPKLRGAQVILDLHDPMPELMMTIFGLRAESFGVRLLKRLEKLSIGFSDKVLTVNQACKTIFGSRSCKPEKIHVVMNAPDEKIFSYHQATDAPERNHGRPFVLMYHGSIVERHGLDLAVKAVEIASKKIPNLRLDIYGPTTPFLTSLMDSVQGNGLRDSINYLGPKSLGQIAKAIEHSDVGIIPNRRSIFTEINTPTRIFEYLSLGRPVIAPQSPGITDYFGKDELVYFELGNAEDLARQIEYVYRNPDEMTEITRRGQNIYMAHRWTQEKAGFVEQVQELLVPDRKKDVPAEKQMETNGR